MMTTIRTIIRDPICTAVWLAVYIFTTAFWLGVTYAIACMVT
jgi:hypothetical protein